MLVTIDVLPMVFPEIISEYCVKNILMRVKNISKFMMLLNELIVDKKEAYF